MGEIADDRVERYASGAWGQPHGHRSGPSYHDRVAQAVDLLMPESITVRNYGGAPRPPTPTFGLNYGGAQVGVVPRQPAAPIVMPFAPMPEADEEHLEAHCSASQIKTKERCIRLWWAEKIAKLARLDKMHFRVGHALHAVAERYLSRVAATWEGLFPTDWDKGLDEEGRNFVLFAAKEAVTLGLWQAVEGIEVECALALLVGKEWLDDRGMPLIATCETGFNKHGVREIKRLTGLLDGRPLPPGYNRLRPFVGFVDVAALQLPIPRISDHKTAKNRRYTLSTEKLAKDRQVNCYAAWALARRRDAVECEVEHIVFLKNPDAPEPSFNTRAVIPIADVRARWAEVIEHAEDMKLVSELVPVEIDKERPYNRADRWKAVRGAVDESPERAKEACSAYGGCPFKDVCHGRATAAEVVKRLDSPSMMDLVKRVNAPVPVVAFGLNLGSSTHSSTHSPTSTPKDTPMAFGAHTAPSFPIGSDCYLLDQQNKAVQFRARILGHPKPGEATIALWPHPDREPYWAALPKIYILDMLISELFASPSPTAKITGYHEELVNAGMGAGAEWKDQQGTINTSPVPAAAPAHASPLTGHTGPAAPPTAADGFSDAKVSRPAAAPFGGTPLVHTPNLTMTMGQVPPHQAAAAISKGHAVAAQIQTAVSAEAANEVPPPNFEPRIGDTLEFLPTAHTFWAKFAGKHALVVSTSMGEKQPMVHISCEGAEYPDLQAGRFKLFSRPAPVAPPAVTQPADSATHERMRQASSSLAASSTASGATVAPLGHPVTATSGGPVPPVQQALPGALLPPTLEAALALVGKSVVFQASHQAIGFNAIVEAVDAEGVTILKVKYPWPTVVRLTALTPGDIPGSKPPKLTAAQKKEQKAKEEADALFADRANALAKATQLATAMSTGEGKVTKKGVEALVPLLTQALAYQEELAHRAPGVPTNLDQLEQARAYLVTARDTIDNASLILGMR